MISISIIGIVGVPACYGGFESLVENLLDHTPSDIEYTVYCSAKAYVKKFSEYKKAKLMYIGLNANGISSIIYDIVSMWRARKSDVLLILGVSGCLFLPILKFFFNGKIITNIDGIEWQRPKWNYFARFFLRVSEKTAVQFSDQVIGDNKGIIDYIQHNYHKKAIAIEYGADHVQPVMDSTLESEYTFTRQPYAVSVCRIEPENHIADILKAFSNENVCMPLIIVGNWKNSDYGKYLFKKYSMMKNFYLLDPIYETNRINFIRFNATIYIHGHSAGGTNPSLVEAMYLRLPILAFDCIYNRATTENNCLYWNTPEQLSVVMNELSSKKLNNIAEKMKHIADKRYLWKIIAKKYCNLY